MSVVPCSSGPFVPSRRRPSATGRSGITFASTTSAKRGVIDPADGRRITTSEGQSYGLFFALVNDDRETFARLLDWTERQLARGDLTGFPPSWLWGRQQDGNWGVLDANSASDSDLWIAYSLLEAGRLWDNHSYSALGTLLLRRIAREEVATLPGLGPVLLPGRKAMRGGTLDPQPQLSASTTAGQIRLLPGALGRDAGPLAQMLQESAPRGFAPDWVDWQADKGWQVTADKGDTGGYDAIRVYLWLGMLSEEDPARASLVAHLPHAGAADRIGSSSRAGLQPKWSGSGQGAERLCRRPSAPVTGLPAQVTLRKQVSDHGLDADAYYGSVLTLFGAGWDQGRYRFAADGTLQPDWERVMSGRVTLGCLLACLMSGALAQGTVQPVAWLLEQVRIGEARGREDLVSNSLYSLSLVEPDHPELLAAQARQAPAPGQGQGGRGTAGPPWQARPRLCALSSGHGQPGPERTGQAPATATSQAADQRRQAGGGRASLSLPVLR